MKKYIYGIVILILVIIALFITVEDENNKTNIPLLENNFSQKGYVSQQEGNLFLVYEKPGAPGLSKKLDFDGESICVNLEEEYLCESGEITIWNFVEGEEVFVEGIEDGDSVLVDNLVLNREPERVFGFVNDVVDNNQNVLVHINSIEFISGDEALQKALEDTDCEVENITDCVPSMSNNFYIRDVNQENEVYILTQESTIRVLQSGSSSLEEVSIERFLEISDNDSFASYPIMIIPDGATILKLEQQYLP